MAKKYIYCWLKSSNTTDWNSCSSSSLTEFMIPCSPKSEFPAHITSSTCPSHFRQGFSSSFVTTVFSSSFNRDPSGSGMGLPNSEPMPMQWTWYLIRCFSGSCHGIVFVVFPSVISISARLSGVSRLKLLIAVRMAWPCRPLAGNGSCVDGIQKYLALT